MIILFNKDEDIELFSSFFKDHYPNEYVLEHTGDDRLFLRNSKIINENDGSSPKRFSFISHTDEKSRFAEIDAADFADFIIDELDHACKADKRFLQLVKNGNLQIDLICCSGGVTNFVSQQSYTRDFADRLYAAGYNIPVKAFAPESYPYYTYTGLTTTGISLRSFDSKYHMNEYNETEKEALQLTQMIKQVENILELINVYESITITDTTLDQKELINKKDEYESLKTTLAEQQLQFGKKLTEHCCQIVDINNDPREYLDSHSFCQFQTRASYFHEYKTTETQLMRNSSLRDALKDLLTSPNDKQRSELLTLTDRFLTENTKDNKSLNEHEKLSQLLTFFDVSDIGADDKPNLIIQKVINRLNIEDHLLQEKCKKLDVRIKALDKEHASGIKERLKEGVDLRTDAEKMKSKIPTSLSFHETLAKDNKEREEKKEHKENKPKKDILSRRHSI